MNSKIKYEKPVVEIIKQNSDEVLLLSEFDTPFLEETPLQMPYLDESGNIIM